MDCSQVEEVSDAMDSVSLANDEENADSSKQARTSKAQKRRVIYFPFWWLSLKSLLRMLKILSVFRTKRLLLRRNGRTGLLRQKWRILQAPAIKRVWSWDRSWWRGTCRSKRSPLMVTACTALWRISWRSEVPLSALKSFGLKQLSTWGAMQTTSCRSSLTPIQETCTLQVNAIHFRIWSKYSKKLYIIAISDNCFLF